MTTIRLRGGSLGLTHVYWIPAATSGTCRPIASLGGLGCLFTDRIENGRSQSKALLFHAQCVAIEIDARAMDHHS